MEECSFCRVVANKLPSIKVFENDSILAFAPLEKDIIAKGHMIVAPKRHYSDIYDIDEGELLRLMVYVKKITQELKAKHKAEGINILHASGKVAQQSCFHFHLHLIPRYRDDGMDLWPKTGYKEFDLKRTYEEMRKLMKQKDADEK